MEYIVMEIIASSGSARSCALEAIKYAKNGNLEKAKEKLDESQGYLGKAHNVQTNLIQNEANGKKTEVNLLLVHAQDHLMNAITIKDISKEFVDMYERFSK